MSDSQDVYARAGIPMPTEPEPEFDPAKDEAMFAKDTLDGPTESTHAEAFDWQKRELEEQDRRLRLECLRIVEGRTVRLDRVPSETEKFFRYVKDGITDPFTMYTFVCGTCQYEERTEDRGEGDKHIKEHMFRFHADTYNKYYA